MYVLLILLLEDGMASVEKGQMLLFVCECVGVYGRCGFSCLL